jgi:hypothetical protein
MFEGESIECAVGRRRSGAAIFRRTGFIGFWKSKRRESMGIEIAAEILAKQRVDGAWPYKGNRPGDEFGENYDLLGTWKNLRFLVEMYGFNRSHPAIQRAAEFILAARPRKGIFAVSLRINTCPIIWARSWNC